MYAYSYRQQQYVKLQDDGLIKFHFVFDGSYVFGRDSEQPIVKSQTDKFNISNQATQTKQIPTRSVMCETTQRQMRFFSGEFSPSQIYDQYMHQYRSQKPVKPKLDVLPSLILLEKLVCQTAFQLQPTTQIQRVSQIKSRTYKQLSSISKHPRLPLILLTHGDRGERTQNAIKLFALTNVFNPEKQIQTQKNISTAAMNEQQTAVTGTVDGEILVFDFSQEIMTQQIQCCDDCITGLEWRNQLMVISCSLDGKICVFRHKNGLELVYEFTVTQQNEQTEIENIRPAQLTCILALEDYFACGTSSGQVILFQYYENKPWRTYGSANNCFKSVVYKIFKFNDIVHAISEDGTARMLENNNFKVVFENDKPIYDCCCFKNTLILMTELSVLVLDDKYVQCNKYEFTSIQATCICQDGHYVYVGRANGDVDILDIDITRKEIKIVE
ncbi:Dynein_intermediate chain [Hexamita inflata]|uniref:Dynein intermediate chain n=1 Tax=Hexamita inflata TaxID=28002 RepID=A0AA86TSN4_9EUKA|nr:Dynein intermediate chain [Hexamita inflata]